MRSVLAPAGEVVTVFDALRAGRLVGAASLAAMLTPVPMTARGMDWLFQQKGYVLGLMIGPAPRYGVLARHGGGGPGYSAGVLTADAGGRRATAVALANTDTPELGMQVAAALLAAAWTG